MRKVSASTRSVTDVEMTTVATKVEGNSSRNLNSTGERIEVSAKKEGRVKGGKNESNEIQTVVQTVVQKEKNQEFEIVIR
jgi:hypothetical protein